MARRREPTAEDRAALVGFGLAVAQMRRELDMTQDLLAGRAGLAGSAVGKIERGEVEATWGTVRRLADGLGISAAELLDLAIDLAPGNGGGWLRHRRRETREEMQKLGAGEPNR